MRANGQNKPTRENILAKKEQKSRPSAKVWKTKEQKGGAYTEKHHYKKKPLQKKTKKKTRTTTTNYRTQNTHVVAQQSGSTGKPLQHSYVCAYVAECNKEA